MENIIENLNIRIGGELLGSLYDYIDAAITIASITFEEQYAKGEYCISFYAPQSKEFARSKYFGTISLDENNSPFQLAVKLLNMKNMEFPDFDAFAKYLQK